MNPAVMTTITVTVRGSAASAADAEARRGEDITWNVDGDLADDDEVSIGNFRSGGGAMTSPMNGADTGRKRKGKGPIADAVKPDAQPGTYAYDVSVRRASAGAASIADPQIQIKP